MIKRISLIALTLFLLGGCTDKEERDSGLSFSQMKCGAGKCGANMFDGNSALAKKKKNILSQMRSDDSRRACVIKAETSKGVYDCVRSPETGKLSLKCGSTQAEPAMKCGAGKCGKAMQD